MLWRHLLLCVLQVESQPASVQGKIFCVTVKKTRAGEVRVLQVNFQSDIIQLSKEVTVHNFSVVSHSCGGHLRISDIPNI